MVLEELFQIFQNTDTKCISVGEFDIEKISFIKEKCPEALDNIKKYTILLWKERIEHIEKHSYDVSGLSAEEMINLIPDILKNPDYIGCKPNENDFQFIKKFRNNILVAVRANKKNNLIFRTMYTITESQLNDYIKKGKAWKFRG